MFLGAALGAASAIAEEKAFQDQIAAMPEEHRGAAIQSRKDWQAAIGRKAEHAEMVEASKPHTLWSFLGLGSK